MNRLYYHLSYQLKLTNHAITVALDKSVHPLGLTLAQANVLLFIDRFPLTTMPRLADFAAVTPQAMHRTLIGLERRGFVHRERKEDNEKTFFLSLTPEGRALLRRAEERIKAAQDAAKDQLSQEEIEILQNLLKKYEGAFRSGGAK